MYAPKSSKFASAAAATMAAFLMTFTAVGPAPESTLSNGSARTTVLASGAVATCMAKAVVDCTPIRA